MRRWMTPAIAILVALLGTLVLARYVQTAERRALAGEQLVTVLVTTEAIPQGTAAVDLEERVRVEQIPRKVAPDGTISELDALADRVTTVALVPGETLVEQRFSDKSATGVIAAPGMLEVTLGLDAARALGGTARPGDQVGVLASFAAAADTPARTELVLDDVLVVRVQVPSASTTASAFVEGQPEPSAADLPDPSRPVMITLAVPPDAATVLVYAAEHGDVWLAGRPDTGDPSVTVAGAR